MPHVFEADTTGVLPQDRLAYWSEGAKAIGGMEHFTRDAAEFSASVRMAKLERFMIGRFRVSANEARWTRNHVRDSSEAFLRLIYQRRGSVEIAQGARKFRLEKGQWTILAASQAHSFRSTETIEALVIIVPRALISASLFEAAGRLAWPMAHDTPTAGLVFRFASEVLRDTGTTSFMRDQFFERAGASLINALLHERLGDRVYTTCKDLRVARIREYIDRNLSDPALCVASIAQAMGCSKRYVHALFKDEGSVHAMIWNSRLERCHHDLSRPDMVARSITTIALRHGFSCPAHFSRLFKARYGKPPREFRLLSLES